MLIVIKSDINIKALDNDCEYFIYKSVDLLQINYKCNYSIFSLNYLVFKITEGLDTPAVKTING